GGGVDAGGLGVEGGEPVLVPLHGAHAATPSDSTRATLMRSHRFQSPTIGPSTARQQSSRKAPSGESRPARTKVTSLSSTTTAPRPVGSTGFAWLRAAL